MGQCGAKGAHLPRDPDAREFALVNKTYVNLLRMWSETRCFVSEG